LSRAVDLGEISIDLAVTPREHSSDGIPIWDIKPATDPTAARSHTFDVFPYHTDASFEEPPPHYFMLNVVRPDQRGGGVQSFIPLPNIMENLSVEATRQLIDVPIDWHVPPEFQKGADKVVLPVLFPDGANNTAIRYRLDCLEQATNDPATEFALKELQVAIDAIEPLQYTPRQNQLIIVDNWHVLHARNQVLDPARHLQRIRFDT
jgi:alpha-ketoglutarate-dependent taurine dioxygenase